MSSFSCSPQIEFNPIEIVFNKRKRSNNFSAYEKSVLIHLIEQYHDIVTSKKTDRNTLEEKDAAWKNIADEFNTILGYSMQSVDRRTTKSLKCLYENLKKKKRFIPQDIIVEQQIHDNIAVSFRNASYINTEYLPEIKSAVLGEETVQEVHQIVNESTNRVLQNPVRELEGKKVAVKRKKSGRIFSTLKLKLLKKELELKELELKTKKVLCKLEIKTQEAKLNLYQNKNDLVQKCREYYNDQVIDEA